MRDELPAATRAALRLIEDSVTGLCAASLELARSRAWNDLLDTLDRLSALLGADPGPPAVRGEGDGDPAACGRLARDWLQGLVLPEYLEESAAGRDRYRARQPEQARADGLGDLVDYLEALRLRLEFAVEGDAARLSMAVGEGDLPVLVATCGPSGLQLDLDLGASRGAWRHLLALAGKVPRARAAVEGLELQQLDGVLRLSHATPAATQMRLTLSLLEPLHIVGRDDDGPVRMEVAPCDLLTIEGEARGTLRAGVEVGAMHAQVSASRLDPGRAGVAECRLGRVQGELRVTAGDRALRLRQLTLGGAPALATRDGEVTLRFDLRGPGADLDLEPIAPGRFVLACERDLFLSAGGPGREVTVSLPAGTRLEMREGRLRVQNGALTLSSAGADARIEVTEGRMLVRRPTPRPDERHPVLRFYECADSPRGGG